MDKPISVFRALFEAGAEPKAGHEALNRLAEFGWATCEIPNDADLSGLAAVLAELRVRLVQPGFVEQAVFEPVLPAP